MTLKIALYGFGSAPVVYRHLIDLARLQGQPVDWCVVLTLPHYRTIMREVLPQRDILDVFAGLPRVPVGGPLTELTGYCGSMAEDLGAQKRQWRLRTGRWLHERGHDYYRLYKAFLEDREATHVLALNVESPDGKILLAAARELGLGVMFVNDLRNLTGTMFACDALETPPAYVKATPETRQQAAAFITAFRKQWAPPRGEPHDISPDSDDRAVLPSCLPPLPARVLGFVRTWRERPDLFDHVYVRNAVMSNSRLLQGVIWGARERINRRRFDLANVAQLPRKFIFYPLQYTPEASINTPAPYFTDQLRVVDALRFAMPSDHALVVKEHWSCVGLRPVGFMRRVMQLPGVQVAHSRMSARDLIERAALTVSVTGTATFEAFLAGRSALALGPGLGAWVLGGAPPIADLARAIRRKLDQPLPDETVIERVAMLLDGRYPFFHGSPHMPGEPVLRRGNIDRLLRAILHHVARERAAATTDYAAAAGV